MNRPAIAALTASAAAATACGVPPQAEIGSPTPQPTEPTTSTSAAPSTTSTTPVEVTVTSLSPVPTVVEPFYVWPEEDDESDAAWWASQEGYDGSYPAGLCGGDLPPCWVLARESGGDPRIWNGGCYNGPCPGGSTASGKWQFLRSTWAGYGGYLNAADAPVEVQDAKARITWAGGQGCSHWAACG